MGHRIMSDAVCMPAFKSSSSQHPFKLLEKEWPAVSSTVQLCLRLQAPITCRQPIGRILDGSLSRSRHRKWLIFTCCCSTDQGAQSLTRSVYVRSHAPWFELDHHSSRSERRRLFATVGTIKDAFSGWNAKKTLVSLPDLTKHGARL